MLNSIEEYLNAEEEAFAQCEDFIPRMERIKEADKIGSKILDFIDKNVENIDFEAIENINVEEIVNDLNLNVNKELDGDVLSDIYKEIDDTFKQGGKVSLKDYLSQGKIILADMLYELKGTVDYSIDYSERQLKEQELKGFERFQLVLSMQNMQELAFCFKLNDAGKSFLNKTEVYLNSIGGEIPFANSVEEKIGELNNSILLISSLESMGSKVIDSVELNNFFSDKINFLLDDLSKYHEDSNIREMFSNLKTTVSNCNNNELIQSISNKLDKVDEKIFENVVEKEKSAQLTFS